MDASAHGLTMKNDVIEHCLVSVSAPMSDVSDNFSSVSDTVPF